MQHHDNIYRAIRKLASALVFLTALSCVLRPPPSPSAVKTPPSGGSKNALKMQALVMAMADDYIASLGESVYLLTRSGKLDSKGRWLAQSFLRNGVGASLDIAVARFDRPPDSKREPLHLTDVRDAAIETGQAAEKVTLLLERLVALLESGSWDQRIATLSHPTDVVINAVFWRGVILIGLLILGIGLLRMVPQRISGGRKGSSEETGRGDR